MNQIIAERRFKKHPNNPGLGPGPGWGPVRVGARSGLGPIWALMGPYGPIWALMGPYGPLWALMGPYEPIWAHLGPFGAHMDPPGQVRT